MTENTPSDALVERLRWGAWYYEDPFDGKSYASDGPLEAADLIETQAREIERLRGALAERNTSQDEMTAEDYEAIYGWGGQG